MDYVYTTRLGYVFVLRCCFVTVYLTRITLPASANPEHIQTRPKNRAGKYRLSGRGSVGSNTHQSSEDDVV
jgi:hypothetical protein